MNGDKKGEKGETSRERERESELLFVAAQNNAIRENYVKTKSTKPNSWRKLYRERN